ncbi:MAG: DNA repair helicase [Candidatus Nitrosotenuis sp.]
MGLRNIPLKLQYRTDRDDLVTDFFIPCLSNSIEYDRAVEFMTLKSISTLSLGLQNFADHEGKIRLITGHRYASSDLDVLAKIFIGRNEIFSVGSIHHSKIDILQKLIQKNKILIKIAIPNSEYVDGSFSERIGIFRDEEGEMVAYTGTSNETFNVENRNFESIDIFTTWNDRPRVDIKLTDFERLWNNETKYVQVYDFVYAYKNNLLKYDSKWAVETIS